MINYRTSIIHLQIFLDIISQSILNITLQSTYKGLDLKLDVTSDSQENHDTLEFNMNNN